MVKSSRRRATVLDVAMAAPDQDFHQERRTAMAAERTWLAWWRTALAASAGALAVGRLAPELLGATAWPYVVLGCAYGGLAVGLLLVGARRQRESERSLRTGEPVSLGFGTVAAFTIAGVLLAFMSAIMVLAQI